MRNFRGAKGDIDFALQVYWNCMTVFETVGRGSIPRRGVGSAEVSNSREVEAPPET